MSIRILLADDDPLVLAALRTILEAEAGLEVVAAAKSAPEAVEFYARHRPDIALLDIRMGDMTGLDAAEGILAGDSEACVLFLTTFQDDDYILRALRMGARGYLLKQDFDRIIPALRAAMAGQRVLGGDIYARLPALVDAAPAAEAPASQSMAAYGIDERERDIIALVAQGLSNREIAARVFLSEGTVRNYISVILEKLALRDRTQLAIFYYRGGKE